MLKREQAKILTFPEKKRAPKKAVCSACQACIYKDAATKLLALAVTVIREIPLNQKSTCERRVLP